MHDIKWIRDNAAAFDGALKRRGLDPLSATLIAIDDKRRAILTALQDAQARRNAASKDIGKAKASKDEATAAKLMEEVAALKDSIAKGEDDERAVNAELEAALAIIPNLPRDDVPDGKDEHDNKEVRKVGTPKEYGFTPKQHFELGEALGLMDFDTAGKDLRRALRVLEGRTRPPRTRDCQLHARQPHVTGRRQPRRLHRSEPAAARERSSRLRHRQPAEVRRRPVQDDE